MVEHVAERARLVTLKEKRVRTVLEILKCPPVKLRMLDTAEVLRALIGFCSGIR